MVLDSSGYQRKGMQLNADQEDKKLVRISVVKNEIL